MFLNLAAWAREEAGDFAGAYRLLHQALALSPGDATVLGAIGAVLRKEYRFEEALAVLDQVVAIAPHYAAAWLERGYTLDALRADAAARASYEKAIALDPGLAPAYGKLADSAAKRGEGEMARHHAARALAIDSAEPAATFALAGLDIEAKDGAAAGRRLQALLAGKLKEEDRTRTLTLIGDALDLEGEAPAAFAAWEQAQKNFRRVFASQLMPSPQRPSHRAFIERIAAQVEDAPAPAIMPAISPTAGEAMTHVFLLGYPRSGTTLVENILASAPNVVALEERDTLADTDGVLVLNDGTMPQANTSDAKLLEQMRAGYWRRVTAMAGAVTDKTFVDMNPFNGIKLPIIARLFPRARIVIMRRDPRDVLLSCFRINFTPSPAAWAFSDLVEAAHHYDALMRLTELCRARLPLAYHEVRYDRLVTDFEPTVRALARFLDIEWSEDFTKFDKTAKSRGVRTASETQVRRGLYDGGGKWRRYAEQLAPALPVIEHWVDRFGVRA